MDKVEEFVENCKELAGTYNESLLNDSLIRLTVKSLSFSPNGNRFLFKKAVLENSHKDAFGNVMPAYKSFERQLVNAQHCMKDNKRGENRVIGFVERATLKDDGVYLDLCVWKRALTDREISQIRARTISVSMETEYTEPTIIQANGNESRMVAGSTLSQGAVRSMASSATVSFIGLALLFDGVKPADPRSGIIHQENASLEVQTVTTEAEISSVEDPTNHELATVFSSVEENPMEQLPDVKILLETAQRELAEAQAAREQADANLLAMAVEFEAKKVEADEQQAKLSEAYSKLDVLGAELFAMRQNIFNSNVEALVNLDALEADVKDWMLSEFREYCAGSSDPDCFMAVAARFAAVAAALKGVTAPVVVEEDAADKSAEVVIEIAEDVAPVTIAEEVVAPDAAVVQADPVTVTEEPTVEVEIASVAPAIAANLGAASKSTKSFSRRHLT